MRLAARTRLLALGPAIATCGCASIWGFHDAKDFADGDVADSGSSDSGSQDAVASGTCICVPDAPDGWAGPFAILHLDAGPDGSCGDPYPVTSYIAGVTEAGAASCQCACDAPIDMRCGIVHTYYADPQCQEKYCARNTLIDGECTATSTCAKPTYFTMSPPAVSGGLCAPIATVNSATPDWTPQAMLCAVSSAASDAGCRPTDACLPRAQSPFDDDTYCITRLGEEPCPAGFYQVNQFVYDDGSGLDSRGCSPCTCEPPTGAACTGNVITYTDTTCGGNGGAVAPPVLCAQVSASSVMVNLTMSEGGSCTPSIVQPTGEFSPTETTVCCAVTQGL
jgi:hypothetical protein